MSEQNKEIHESIENAAPSGNETVVAKEKSIPGSVLKRFPSATFDCVTPPIRIPSHLLKKMIENGEVKPEELLEMVENGHITRAEAKKYLGEEKKK